MTNGHPRVSIFLPSLAGGGAERSMVNLAVGFSARGFSTDVVLADAQGPYLSLLTSAIRVIDLKTPRVLRALPALAGYLRRERPGALISALDHSNLVAMAASRLSGTGTRTVCSVQCTFEKGVGGTSAIQTAAIPWLFGRLHRWADVVAGVSHGVAEDIIRTTGMPRERVSVIHNPVITDGLYRAAADRDSHSWRGDDPRPIVLGVGRLVPQKNFPLLIEAFALVRRRHDVRLMILGEGPGRPALEDLIRREGLEGSCDLPGFVDNPYGCMAKASVFVLSSDFEGLPTVLIESLALGTPVVATDCDSGPREILRGGALGELVPMRDAHALAEAIERTLTVPRPATSAEELRPYTLEAVIDQFQEACGFNA